MQSGSLDRTIVVERLTRTIDDAGTPVESWAPVAMLRASLYQNSTDEFIRAFGESGESVFVFRTRWIDGVTLQDRVTYEGQAFNLRDIKELGRRRGLELRCQRVGP